MHTPDVLFFVCVCLYVCVCMCRRQEEGVGVWLLLWVLAVGPRLPTDGHRAGWVLGISHIQLSQHLYQSVCSQSLSSSISLSPCLSRFLTLALREEKFKCSVFCARSLSLLFGFRLNYLSCVVCPLVCVSQVMFGRHY